MELQRLNPLHHSHKAEVILQSLHFQLLQALGLLFLYLNMVCTIKFIVSLRGRRLKGKGKRIRARDHARGRREEGTLPPSSCAPRVSLAPKTPFPKTPFPFPFKRLPRRLIYSILRTLYIVYLYSFLKRCCRRENNYL